MFKRLFTGAMVFGMAAIAPPGLAQSACSPREIVAERLGDGYHELQLATGVQTNGNVIEIWASPATGTWTILMTVPNGTSCVMSSGTGWALGLLDDAPKGTPS